jgi:hypothetical protein
VLLVWRVVTGGVTAWSRAPVGRAVGEGLWVGAGRAHF